jgi:GWxTD domain-containing protein
MRPDSTFTSKFRGEFFQIPLKNQFVKISSTVTNQSIGYFNFSEPTIQCEALCMQYICTNDEIEELKKASNKFDYYTQFWLKAAKQDLQLATQLHAEFRRRIVNANQKFSSYKMGSLTDRGMIYIVFGDYIAAEKTDFSEKWIYANTGDALNEFLFRQSKNEFISNHFVLERDLASKSVYYFAVEKWRNGLIELKD